MKTTRDLIAEINQMVTGALEGYVYNKRSGWAFQALKVADDYVNAACVAYFKRSKKETVYLLRLALENLKIAVTMMTEAMEE